jgi:CBS domain-containing protein
MAETGRRTDTALIGRGSVAARPRPDSVAPPALDPTARRVGDMLGRPLVACPPTTAIREGARLMAERDINSVVVVGPGGEARGIVTDSDLRRRVVATGLAGSTAIEAVMSAPLVTIDADAFFFEAVHTMLRHRLHHLVVVQEGRPLGVIADGDLLAARAQGPLFVARQIDLARSLEQLAELRPARERAVRVLFRAGVNGYDIGRITAETNDHLVRRVLGFVEDELGPPPMPYCWLGLGSEGRREQTLRTDQDNALVYRDPPRELAATAESYFTDLANRAVAALERCGFPLCEGGVMATNAQWRQPLEVWRGHFARWVRRPEPEALYKASIFFDLRPIAGDDSLADALWDDLTEWIPESPLFIQHMMRAALNHRPPLGFFRSLVVEHSGEHRGAFHVKARGLMPVVEAARAYALGRGITLTNTCERLRALRDLGAMPERDADDLLAAYDFVMRLRIRHQLEQIAAGQPLDNFIVPDRLSRADRMALKEHFKVIADLQGFIHNRIVVGATG